MWDVMLDLFIAHERGSRVTAGQLALSGEIEREIVHHAIAVLVVAGLVVRTVDSLDERLTWLTLSPAGHAGMVEHFAEAAGFMRPFADVEPGSAGTDHRRAA
jgi:DNA-binding MarR family transcriptional regulator